MNRPQPSVLVVSAFTGELAKVLEQSQIETKHLDADGLPGYQLKYSGIDLSVGFFGVGADTAKRRMQDLLSSTNAQLVIICGCCGALEPSLRPGDCIIPDEILGAGKRLQVPLAKTLRALLSDSGSRLSRGPLVNVSKVLERPEDKAAVAQETGAEGCDMESFAAFEQCLQRGIPGIVLRVVVDALEDVCLTLEPDFDELGRPRIWGGLRLAVFQPWKIPTLIQMGRHFEASQTALAQTLQRALESPGWPSLLSAE